MEPLVLHATAVAVAGRAVVILGPSGSGKSGLALQLMALGAGLISDDLTGLQPAEGPPLAFCPAPDQAGRIEARGMGILSAPAHPPAPVALALDLTHVETARLPPERHLTLAGYPIPLFHKVDSPYFAAAILHYMRSGWSPR